jgi:hypothetical protein
MQLYCHGEDGIDLQYSQLVPKILIYSLLLMQINNISGYLPGRIVFFLVYISKISNLFLPHIKINCSLKFIMIIISHSSNVRSNCYMSFV